MYLVLIDSRVQDTQSIIGSLTENTDYVLFNFQWDNIETIKSRITGNYENIAIIQHKYNYDVYRLIYDFSNAILENLETEDPNLTSWVEYIDFLQWLKNERGAQYIDLLACDLWADANWRYMIETVRTRYNIYIRASLDITGQGGDFILESDNIDTIGMYFTPDILEYKYSFYGYQTPAEIGFANYRTYTLPASNLAKISNRYSSLLNRTPPATYTDVVSTASNGGAVAIVRANGNVVLQSIVAGFGGSMPAGIVSQSDLVNVKKVVASSMSFAALKNDGTVICWGFLNIGRGNQDINTITNLVTDGTNSEVVNVNSVRSQLVDVVDIFSTIGNAFAALTSTGKVITWGLKTGGAGDPSNVTQTAFKSSGVTKIIPASSSFSMLKNDGTSMILYTQSNQYLAYFSTTHFNISSPIVDMYVHPSFFWVAYLRQNGSTFDLVLSHTGATIYTLPQGVSILKFVCHANSYQFNIYFLLSNNTVAAYQNFVFSLITNNVTDIETTGTGGGGAFAMIQNGTVVVSGSEVFGGNLASTSYGLRSGLNLNNPVRLYSTCNSFGILKSDNTFVWVGLIMVPYVENYASSTFPSNAAQTTLSNAISSNVKAVYASFDGYAVVKNDNSIAVIGVNGASGVVTSTKDANTNVHFETVQSNFYAYEIPFLPSLTPTSIFDNSGYILRYYVSNPDNRCAVGRKYQLFNGATLIDTFYPKPENDTHTYVFSNVIMPAGGTFTLDIRDTTTIPYTVTSFSLQVISSVYPCFLEGSKILRMNPETDTDEYVAVEKLRRGDLILTAEHGYKAIELIGCTKIQNPNSANVSPSKRLYWFRKSKIRGMTEDLCVTGDHCILHKSISEEKKASVMEYMRDIYVTESHYRVPAFLDDRAEQYTRDGPATIWHFALENPNIYHNYGVMANGLLVESCSLHYMYKHSNMKMV